MPNQITDVIVHKLLKDAHKRAATSELRNEPLAVNKTVQSLIDHLYKLYADKTGKGYGRFEDDANEYPAQRYIQDHIIENGIEFHELSTRLMNHLCTRAAAEALATGGYVLVAKITTETAPYLLVAIVTEVVGTAITEGLDVIESVHLDMNHLRVAGRVDLTAWQTGGDRYISFLKGRGEVAGYFKLFLGCNDVLVALQESKKLVVALEEFSKSQELDASQKDNLFEAAFEYLDELGKSGTELNLDAMSNHLWPDAPADFRLALADEALALSDGFVPDRRVIKSLIRFEGKSTHWKLSFDRKALRNGDLNYDPESDTITLKNLPGHLRQELLEETAHESDEI